MSTLYWPVISSNANPEAPLGHLSGHRPVDQHETGSASKHSLLLPSLPVSRGHRLLLGFASPDHLPDILCNNLLTGPLFQRHLSHIHPSPVYGALISFVHSNKVPHDCGPPRQILVDAEPHALLLPAMEDHELRGVSHG